MSFNEILLAYGSQKNIEIYNKKKLQSISIVFFYLIFFYQGKSDKTIKVLEFYFLVLGQ